MKCIYQTSKCDTMYCCNCPDYHISSIGQRCYECGDDITVEDEYCKIDGKCFHIECLRDIEPHELCEMLNLEIRREEEDERI